MKKILFFFAFATLTSCKTTQTSMLIGESFDKSKNQTTLTLLPYGNIVIPNKWTKSTYNKVSKQHFFVNEDKTTLAVAKNPTNKYPFYKTNQTDKKFVTEFVKWDAEHWKQQGVIVKTLTDKSENGYITWQAKTENQDKVNTIFIFGSKNGFAYNFSGTSRTWTDEKIIEFITLLYNNN